MNMKKIIGFSLVELLTALLISTLIVLGIGQAFISQKVSYRTQNGLSRVQQTGRFVVEYVGNDIRRAGFPGIVEESSGFFDAIVPALSVDGGGNTSDTITVMYRTTTDCLGATTPVYADGNQYAKNQYRIADPDADGNNDLTCRTFNEANAQLDGQVLARGVENMQVMYGVNNQFVSADTVAGGGDWAEVTGVRISFLVNSVEITTDFTDTNTYVLLNADSLGPFNDSQRRRVFTTTSTIRNRLDRS